MTDPHTHLSAATEHPLLPCPFCGSDNLKLYDRQSLAWVACIDCGLEAPSETGVTVDQARTYWNSRAGVAQSVAKPAYADEAFEYDAETGSYHRIPAAQPPAAPVENTDDIDWDTLAEERLGQRSSRSSAEPAAPVDTSARSDGKTIGEFYGDPGERSSAETGEVPEKLMRATLQRILDNRDNKNWRKPEIVQEVEHLMKRTARPHAEIARPAPVTDWEDVERRTNVAAWCEACQSNHWSGQCDPDTDEQRMPR